MRDSTIGSGISKAGACGRPANIYIYITHYITDDITVKNTYDVSIEYVPNHSSLYFFFFFFFLTSVNPPKLNTTKRDRVHVRIACSQFHQYSKPREDIDLNVSQFGLVVRLVSRRGSARFRFGSPFSSKRLWFVDTVL